MATLAHSIFICFWQLVVFQIVTVHTWSRRTRITSFLPLLNTWCLPDSAYINKYLLEAEATMFLSIYHQIHCYMVAKSGSVHELPENHSWQWRKAATQANIVSNSNNNSSNSKISKKVVILASPLARSVVTLSRSSVQNSTFYAVALPCFCVGMSVENTEPTQPHNTLAQVLLSFSIYHHYKVCNIKRVVLCMSY